MLHNRNAAGARYHFARLRPESHPNPVYALRVHKFEPEAPPRGPSGKRYRAGLGNQVAHEMLPVLVLLGLCHRLNIFAFIKDYVRLAVPEPEVPRVIGKESLRKCTNNVNTTQMI